MEAEARLYATGFLLCVPAVAAWVSWTAKANFAVARTALAVGALGWLFYVASTIFGPAL